MDAREFTSGEKESSGGEDVGDLSLEAMATYAQLVGVTLERAQKEGERHYGWALVRRMVYRLRKGGVRPAAFVTFVVRRVAALRQRRPYFAEVFGERAFEGWLPIYLREGANARGGFRYVTPPARRARYEERFMEDMGPTAEVRR